MIDRQQPLPVVQQCQILEIARSSVYSVPQPGSAATLALMRQMDELHLQSPCAGSRMLRDLLRLKGVAVGRKHVATLMRRMGIAALYPHPRTTQPHPGHAVFPYLLRDRAITAPNQVWAMDITYIPMRRGFVYLAAVLDWATVPIARGTRAAGSVRPVHAVQPSCPGSPSPEEDRGRDDLEFPGNLSEGRPAPNHRHHSSTTSLSSGFFWPWQSPSASG